MPAAKASLRALPLRSCSTWAEVVVSTGGRAKPIGVAFLREAVSPPRDSFVQDVRIHWTVVSMTYTRRVVEELTLFLSLASPDMSDWGYRLCLRPGGGPQPRRRTVSC